MAHDHDYSITFLKTPYGFLTKSGEFTQDISSDEIFMLPSNSYGKWASRKSRIKYFCQRANVKKEIMEELCEHEGQIETYTYFCHAYGTKCVHGDCERKLTCNFWNGDRGKMKLSRLN